MALTLEQTAALAAEVEEWLLRWELDQEVSLFFNGVRHTSHGPWGGVFHEEADDPGAYTDHVAEDHILTLLLEGPLYEMLYEGSLGISAHLLAREERETVEEMLHGYMERLGLYSELALLVEDYRHQHPEMVVDSADVPEYREYLEFREDEDQRIRLELLPELLEVWDRDLTGMVLEEWEGIFRRYGVRYDLGEDGSLTCFYEGTPSVYRSRCENRDGSE